MVAEKEVQLLDRMLVLSLAPPDLANHRAMRYRGEEQAIALGELGADDRALITRTYGLLKELYTLVSSTDSAHEIGDFVARSEVRDLGLDLRGLGRSDRYDDHVASALHDLRGGAVNALLIELANPRSSSSDRQRTLSIMTRDVLKLARTLIIDIDPPLRARDLEQRLHSIGHLRCALENFRGSTARGLVKLRLSADGDRFIADSCAELGTVERIAFNLLSNAAANSANLLIEGWLAVVGEHLRFVVANTVNEFQRIRLRDVMRTSPAALYSDFSTTGSGKGLQVTADLVARAYGIHTAREVVDGGYVGSVLSGSAFIGWFHWPLAE